MDWVEWIGILSGVGTVAGLWLGVAQLRRTANAATATQRAVEETVRQMASYQLLLLLPQLQFFGETLERAVEDNDTRAARITLVQWHRLASELKGMLSTTTYADAGLIDRLDRSVVLSARAKRSLVTEKTNLADTLVRVQPSIDDVTQHLGALAGQLRAGLTGEGWQVAEALIA